VVAKEFVIVFGAHARRMDLTVVWLVKTAKGLAARILLKYLTMNCLMNDCNEMYSALINAITHLITCVFTTTSLYFVLLGVFTTF